MATASNLTTTELLGAASSILERYGYRPVDVERLSLWAGPPARIYEDPYGIVALVVYETWGQIVENWQQAQAALVELISSYFTKEEAKAWEGYLVLMTPSIVPLEAQTEAKEIRSDTTHLRKLLATGEEIGTVADVEQALLPLLPLRAEALLTESQSALELLPELLSRGGISERSVSTIVDAFREQRPLVEALHGLLTNGEHP